MRVCFHRVDPPAPRDSIPVMVFGGSASELLAAYNLHWAGSDHPDSLPRRLPEATRAWGELIEAFVRMGWQVLFDGNDSFRLNEKLPPPPATQTLT